MNTNTEERNAICALFIRINPFEKHTLLQNRIRVSVPQSLWRIPSIFLGFATRVFINNSCDEKRKVYTRACLVTWPRWRGPITRTWLRYCQWDSARSSVSAVLNSRYRICTRPSVCPPPAVFFNSSQFYFRKRQDMCNIWQ